MKKYKLLITTISLFALLSLLIGCDVEEGSNAEPTNKNINTVEPKTNNEDTIVKEEPDILTIAVSADVDTSSPKNWDADAEDDGVIVYPSILDKNGNAVKFEGTELDVDIEIWDTKFNEESDQVKDKKVYTGKGTIDSWKDGDFFYDGGIRVSFDDIEKTSTKFDHGYLIITIHLPDGRTLGAESNPNSEMGIRLKP